VDLTGTDFAYRYHDNPPTRTHRGHSETIGWYKRNSLFMPRDACRIYLEITNVRCEKLQDISENDAIAEGVEVVDMIQGYPLYRNYERPSGGFSFAGNSYETLFESINGPGSWNENPFVWVVEFKRIEKP
jgi:hypothetical protein